MDELREEFKGAVSLKTINAKKRRLEKLQNKMASLKFLDIIIQRLIQFNYPKSYCA